MELKSVVTDFAVSGQITPADLGEVAKAGYKTVVCNRPDSEIEHGLQATQMAAEAARLGLVFVYNPISNNGMTLDNLVAQATAQRTAPAPLLAYCRSGTRSITCWAFTQAGDMSADDIIRATDQAGYQLEKIRPQIDMLAGQKT